MITRKRKIEYWSQMNCVYWIFQQIEWFKFPWFPKEPKHLFPERRVREGPRVNLDPVGLARDQPRREDHAARPVEGREALVERFDIEPFPDFSAKWANFTGLALFCIDAKFCK